MNYRLAVLTHGDSEPLAETLASFAALVLPWPTSIRVFADGATGPDRVLDAFTAAFPPPAPSIAVTHPSRQEGFCGATRRLWADSVSAEEDFVFWLEGDFVFTKPIDLADIAAVLSTNPSLAQISLMRQPVNETEKAAGGLVASRPGEFKQRFCDGVQVGRPFPWLEHRSYFTTNASLMFRSFMDENPWPDYATAPSECEGKFGVALVSKGYRFGVWGTSEPWILHIGDRKGGFGY